MKLNELRIGNWVQIDDLPPEQITLSVFETLSKNPHHISLFHGIELNPELFEQIGFRKGEKWYIHQVFYKGKFEVCYNRNEVIYGEKTEHGFDKKSIDIPYLHQLQNLYWSLFGEELKVTF